MSEIDVEVLGLFQEEEFETAMDELDNPKTDGWELFVSTGDVTIYRQYDEVGFILFRIQNVSLQPLWQMTFKNSVTFVLNFTYMLYE